MKRLRSFPEKVHRLNHCLSDRGFDIGHEEKFSPKTCFDAGFRLDLAYYWEGDGCIDIGEVNWINKLVTGQVVSEERGILTSPIINVGQSSSGKIVKPRSSFIVAMSSPETSVAHFMRSAWQSFEVFHTCLRQRLWL